MKIITIISDWRARRRQKRLAAYRERIKQIQYDLNRDSYLRTRGHDLEASYRLDSPINH